MEIIYLYKVSQGVNNNRDTYDAMIVAAPCEKSAKKIHPDGYGDDVPEEIPDWHGSWAQGKDLHVELIGTAVPGTKAGVILASYNGG